MNHAVAVESGSDNKQCACGSGRSCGCEREQPVIQRFGTGPRPATTTAAAVLDTPGVALPMPARTRFERAFGVDLSHVRTHHDGLAARAASDLESHAWTSGHHIVFARDRFAPGTPAGDRLLAHELTHVVQQRRATATADFRGDDPVAEAHAEQVAHKVTAGNRAGIVSARPPGIARQPHGRGVTRVDINCQAHEMTFNGPSAHTWRLTDCDLSDGEYTATVERARGSDGQPIVRFRINNAPTGTRFNFQYRVEGRELNPYDAVSQGQSVHIHAVSAPPTATTASATSNRGVTFQVAAVDAATYQQRTGRSVSSLPEGRIVEGSGITLGQFARGAGFGGVRAPLPFPSTTTGVLWTGQHMADLAAVDGSLTVRGFRAPFDLHLRSAGERLLGNFGGDATYALNSGVPGSYANDYWYLYSPGARLVHRGPLDTGTAQAGRNRLLNAAEGMEGRPYRFSPPPRTGRGAAGYERLSGGDPNYICQPGQNCITLGEHDAMLGGNQMTINPRPDQPVDIATGNVVGTDQPYVFERPNGEPYSGPGYATNADAWAAGEGGLPSGLRSTPVAGGMQIRGVLKAGGVVLLIYGVYSSATRIADASDSERATVIGEEGGSWIGGWIGSVIGSAVAGAVVCSEIGPGAVICSGAFAVAGGVTGSVFGADIGHDVVTSVQDVGDLLRNPAALTETAVQLFGSDEDRRRYYDNREVLQNIGF